MVEPGYGARILGACLVAVAGIAAHALPLPATSRGRMLEILPLALLLLAVPTRVEPSWYACLAPFSAASFVTVRMLRSKSVPAPTVESLNAEPELGAHSLSAGPLLALAVTTAWSAARGGEALGWIVSGVVLMSGIQTRQVPYRSAVFASIAILAGTALVTR